MANKIILVSCVSKKLSKPAPAKDLYQSSWFKKARAYAEIEGDQWFVLSAKHGLLLPDEVIEPYDISLSKMPHVERVRWADLVGSQLSYVDLLGDFTFQSEVQLLAGQMYRRYLIPWLEQSGFTVTVPMKGLGIGQQLRWLMERVK